jgi:hypothetical protein
MLSGGNSGKPEARKVKIEFMGNMTFDSQLVDQIVRDCKYGYFLNRVIVEGSLHYIPDIRFDSRLIKILETEPKGEVLITPKTVVTLSEKNIL